MSNDKIQTFISSNTLIIANFYRKLSINEKLYYFQGFFKDLGFKIQGFNSKIYFILINF